MTRWLRARSDGDETARASLLPLVEAELHRTARAYTARERREHTLQAARLMREVLVDHARPRRNHQRGGDAQRVALADDPVASRESEVDIIDLDRAHSVLAPTDPREACVIEFRDFGGLSLEETAEVLHLSAHTIKRDWRLAKMWLAGELKGKTS